MDVLFSKRLIAVGGLLFVLSLFSFTLTTFSEDSCLGGNSTLDNQTCIVGENAQISNNMEGETNQSEVYGQFQILQNNTIIEESNWSTIQTTSTSGNLSQLNKINFSNFNNIQSNTATFTVQDSGQKLIAQNVDTNCNCWYSTNHINTIESGESFEYEYDMKITDSQAYARISHGLYPDSISDSSQGTIGWGITYQGGEEGYFRTLNNSIATTPYNYNEWYTIQVSRSSDSENIDFHWEDSNGNTVDDYTIEGDTSPDLENFKMVGGRDRDFTNEGNWDATYRNLSLATEESLNEYTYSKDFENKFNETGNYEYKMIVSEEEDGQVIDEFEYPFEVVKAPNPSNPLDSFTNFLTNRIEEIISKLFGFFENREIGTPEVN